MITLVIIIVVIAALLGLVAMFIYNKLVEHREHVRSAYAQIDVQLNVAMTSFLTSLTLPRSI